MANHAKHFKCLHKIKWLKILFASGLGALPIEPSTTIIIS